MRPADAPLSCFPRCAQRGGATVRRARRAGDDQVGPDRSLASYFGDGLRVGWHGPRDVRDGGRILTVNRKTPCFARSSFASAYLAAGSTDRHLDEGFLLRHHVSGDRLRRRHTRPAMRCGMMQGLRSGPSPASSSSSSARQLMSFPKTSRTRYGNCFSRLAASNRRVRPQRHWGRHGSVFAFYTTHMTRIGRLSDQRNAVACRQGKAANERR